jgi:thiamine transport system permease protein
VDADRLRRLTRGQRLWRLVLWLPVIAVLLGGVYPAMAVFGRSLVTDAGLDFSGFERLFSSAFYLRTVAITFVQAGLSTLFTVLLAVPAAFVLARYEFRGRRALLALSTVPFVLPTVVVAIAFTALLGPAGYINRALMGLLSASAPPIQLENTLWIIILVHVFFNFAVVLRMVVSYWSRIGFHQEEAARTLGASNWQIWWAVRLPAIMPAIKASALLVFLFTFTSFGIVLILGGPRVATIEVQIYNQTLNLFNLPLAAALSLVQALILLLVVAFFVREQRQNAAPNALAPDPHRLWPATSRERALVWFTGLGVAVLTMPPLMALLYQSLTAGANGLTMDHYFGLFRRIEGSILPIAPIDALVNSMLIAALVVVVAGVLGALGAFLVRSGSQPIQDMLLMSPLYISAVTLGVGYMIAFDRPPLELRTSWLILPIAHTMVALPFVMRSILPALRAIPGEVLDAAATLGATPLRRRRTIELPIARNGLVLGALFGFTVSMGEFGATSFLVRPDILTAPVVIYRFLGQPDPAYYGQAMALSVVLAALCGFLFLLVDGRNRSAGAMF